MGPYAIVLLILSIVFFLAYLVWKTLHFSVPFLQRKLAFMPIGRSDLDLITHANAASDKLAFKNTECRTQDGERLTGIVGVWREDSDRLLIFLHGNSYSIEYCTAHAILVAEKLEANVLIMDYRGFGSSSGSPTAWGLRLDGDAMLAHGATSLDRPFPYGNIVVMGHSMGCAVALHLARRHDAFAGLVLSAPFDEFRHAAFHVFLTMSTPFNQFRHAVFPILQFVAGFMTEMFDNVEAVRHVVDTPLLISHSPQDEVCPYDGGRAVFLSASTRVKKWVDSEQCSHSGPHVNDEGLDWLLANLRPV